MKPDGLATEPSEPMEAEAIQLEAEPTVNEGATQNGTTASPSQPDEPQNGKEAPSTGKDVPVDSKGKSKGPVKSKTTTAGPGPGTKPRITQSRVANGTAKPAASSATKKPIAATNATAEKKPSSAVGVPKNKPAGPSTLGPRAQPKVTTVGTSRTTTTTTVTSGTKTKTAVSTANTLSKRPATASASAAAKPKSTAPAPRPNTAKPSTSTTAKTTTAPKTNRTIGSSTQRPSTTSATSKTSTTTSTATTTTTTTASRTNRTTAQPIKPLVTASTTRKDAGKTATTAPAKKPVAAVTSRPAASKPLNSEAPKTAAATKRPMPSIKPPHPKQDDKKSVPTRKVPPSPRNTSSRPTSGKTAAASTGRSTTATGKLSASKPTQSVLPLVKGKQTDKEPAVQSLQLSVAAVSITTAAAIATEESVSGSEANPIAESSHDVPASTSPDVPASSSLDVPASLSIGVPTSSSLDVLETIDVPVLTTNDDTEPPPQDELVEAGLVEVSDARPTTPEGIQELDEQDSEKVDEKLNIAVAPVAQETVMQKTVTASLFDNPATTVVPSAGLEVAEKADGINIECCEDVEEEEREGSQQVSLSEMSGTQPTEESRPGSVGPSGSIWRAGALLSELDSEDVSCSQQGASELSAPGVLEGTESMDDLGDASLKGAEGASVGSPDFEKVPDILTNEEDEDDDDEDDDDRVYDMDVGSERAEDSHRQHHEDEEDEDVEMASEGITESGLESYGNADEDDLTEDYRLDNLNRIQPPSVDMSVFPGAPWNQPSCFSDPWAQLPQPASTLLSSPSSEHCQADAETPTQAHAQETLDVSNSESGPSSPYGPNLLEAPSCSSQSPPSTAEEDVCPKQVLTPQDCETELGTFNAPELGFDSKKDTSKPEDVNDDSCLVNVISKIDHQPEQLNALLPEIVQDLGVHFECANEEEEQETFPADDLLGGPATAPASVPSSSSSATEDEASDTEGEMQISDPQEEQPVTEAAPVTHNLSALEEREEISGEIEGGGSDTSQSATSAASYGFDYMTSNSNAQSSAESCSKSPGIFSLENEEQLLDEAKDTSLFKELTLIPTPAVGEEPEFLQSQHVEFQSHLEQQYMLCGESSELKKPDLPPQVATSQSGLNDSSSPQHLEEPDLETPHPYYSTICENTDSSMAGRNSHFPPQQPNLIHIQMAMSSKLRQRPRSVNGTQPLRLPTDLPPRKPTTGSNAQLQCLEQHQEHLHKIQQWQEKRNQEQERQEDSSEKKVSTELKQEQEAEELEKQRRNLLELQLKQQEQELKQRQQIMQWQQELEQQQQEQKKHKVHTPVLLSPTSGLCTIYETVETSDLEEEGQEKSGKTEEAEHENVEMLRNCDEKHKDVLYPPCTTPTVESQQKELEETDVASDLPSPPQSPSESPEGPTPIEFDWGKKADIVHHLIKQTLMLKGDSYSPLLLLPGGAGGTLSPLETSLWPNLLPPLTPTSATVTSVSSFSPEAQGSSSQGEWTVVELETHH